MENVIQLEAGALLVERYSIVKRIGGGGMGSVYLAKDKRLADAYRAVKEMIGTFNDEAQRKKVIEDFERESQLLASLDHPAIPTIYDYFHTNGCYYLVMKYIAGGDLAGRLKAAPDGHVDEKTVVEWGIQIADVLFYLHSQKPEPIIYRDMKPANIMIDERERIVLVDFGIARFVSAKQKNVTAIGTMGYAPPELFAGKVEPRSDIYSLGATMFHLLTGRDPQDNPLLMFDFNRNPRPRQINPKLTPEIDAILAKSVEHKPANRYSSAEEMKNVLEEHLRRLTGQKGKSQQLVIGGPSPAPAPSDGNFCGQCGQKQMPGNLFCQNCGARQDSAAAQPLTASLVFVGANNQPISFLISKDTNAVGRLDTNRGIVPDIDLSPFDKEGKVSRRHAIIHRQGDKILLEDIGSTNGSFVNGVRLQPKQLHQLHSGDDVRVGETNLKFFIGAVPANVSAPPPVSPTPGVVMGTQKNAVVDMTPTVKPAGSGAPPPPPPGFQPKLKMGDSHPSLRVNKDALAQSGPSQPMAQGQPAGQGQQAIPAIDKPVATSEPSKPHDPTGELKRPPTEGLRIERYISDVTMEKRVKLGQTVDLTVGMLTAPTGSSVAKPHPYDTTVEVKLPQKDEVFNVNMEVYVAAPGFEIEPDIYAQMSLPLGCNANPKTFHLKAVQAGVMTVTIDFYQESDYLNSVSIETEIVE